MFGPRLRVLIILSCWIFDVISPTKIDVTKTVVHGPGLVADANIPVRFIFIHAHDSQGEVISDDLPDGTFNLGVESKGQEIRVGREVLNLHNGTFIARFRLNDFGGDLEISITHNGQHVAKSPYILENVYGEDCDCPMPLETWTEALECPSHITQLESDLEPFEKIDLDRIVTVGIPKWAKNRNNAFCHYVIKNNRIFRQCHGKYTGFKMFPDATLLSLTKKVKLPDIEFLINLGDWPLERGPKEDAIPIFSWCGSESSTNIVLPTWDTMRSVLEMLWRISLDIFSVQANTGPKWEDKSNMGFFRGRDARQERLNLAEMSVKNPDMLDCAITNYFFFKKNETKCGKQVKSVPFYDFFKHKYLINVDGTVAAYRMPYSLVGDSLIFKQESEYYEHFYEHLKPWVHYVPLKHDLSDVIEKIKWAREHDDEAKKIQQTGTKLGREILTPDRILCYHVVAFNKYAARQTRPVIVLVEMEEVKQPESRCDCHRKEKAENDAEKDEL